MELPLSQIRAIQRHFAALVRDKRLLVEGQSRARRYRLSRLYPVPVMSVGMAAEKEENELKIPLSAAAESISLILFADIYLM